MASTFVRRKTDGSRYLIPRLAWLFPGPCPTIEMGGILFRTLGRGIWPGMAWDGPLSGLAGATPVIYSWLLSSAPPFVPLCKVNRLTDKVLVSWTIWHCASLFNVRNNGPVSLFWPSGDPIYQMPDWCTTQKVSVWIQPFLYVWWLIFAYLPPNCFTAKLRWHI